MMEDDNQTPIPTQGGQIYGYEVQIKRSKDSWEPANMIKDKSGVPLPLMHNGILNTMGFYGYAQSKSLAWMIKAIAASEGKQIDVRIVPFKIIYDIKCYILEDEAKIIEE